VEILTNELIGDYLEGVFWCSKHCWNIRIIISCPTRIVFFSELVRINKDVSLVLSGRPTRALTANVLYKLLTYLLPLSSLPCICTV